jgi:beta-1,4-galactosyltransferase 1
MKLGVCVPYRNREAHLKEFIPKIGKYLDAQGIDYHIYFGHQVDDKLFNRGATKNIAAKHAFEEGCDYVVWHDIDMIPEEGGGADYSFPKENPRHIATNISQMNYQLKYEEYFGGAIVFSKEQVERTNGYSNDYWDWGMEDDDLFWRCVLEGYTEKTYIYPNKNINNFISFNGNDSYVEIPCSRALRNLTSRSHTLSVLVRANQQEDKVPIWLVGDKDRRFVEYPILRRPGYDYGLSYNNSRTYTSQLWNNKKEHLYSWMKRYENQWTWITLVVNENNVHFYMNGKESDARWGTGTPSPQIFDGMLKRYGRVNYYLGTTTSVADDSISKWFRGDIADVRMWNRALTPEQVSNIHNEVEDDGLILHYDFENGLVMDKSDNDNNGIAYNCKSNTEDIEIPNTSVPHRVPGRMFCLEHEDEGLVKNKNGKDVWAKGETTARNEKRFVKEMQGGTWDYKSDGINSLKYELVSVEEITPKAKYINIKL